MAVGPQHIASASVATLVMMGNIQVARRTVKGILRLPESPRWALPLVALNLMGSLYGFWWYAAQLAITPWWQWPVVPDSPLSALLFTCFLVFWYWGRPPALLGALALLGMLKYGAWTVFIFVHTWWGGHGLLAGDLLLVLSHLGMLLEALIFLRYLRLPGQALLAAAIWYGFNDLADYGFDFHPELPVAEYFLWVAGSAVMLTVASTLVLWLGTARKPGHA